MCSAYTWGVHTHTYTYAITCVHKHTQVHLFWVYASCIKVISSFYMFLFWIHLYIKEIMYSFFSFLNYEFLAQELYYRNSLMKFLITFSLIVCMTNILVLISSKVSFDDFRPHVFKNDLRLALHFMVYKFILHMSLIIIPVFSAKFSVFCLYHCTFWIAKYIFKNILMP